jgi:hypothetical protein
LLSVGNKSLSGAAWEVTPADNPNNSTESFFESVIIIYQNMSKVSIILTLLIALVASTQAQTSCELCDCIFVARSFFDNKN